MIKQEQIKEKMKDNPELLLIDKKLLDSETFGKYLLVNDKRGKPTIIGASIDDFECHHEIAYAFMILHSMEKLYVYGGGRFNTEQKRFYDYSMNFYSVPNRPLENVVALINPAAKWNYQGDMDNENGHYSKWYSLQDIEKMT